MSRTRLLVIVVAAVVVAAAAVYLAGGRIPWLSGSSAAAPQSCDLPQSVAAGAPAAANLAPGGGGLRVVEQGFSQDQAKQPVVAFGAVLENTSGSVAYRTRISYRLTDTQPRPVLDPTTGHELVQDVPVLLPGQRIGLGASFMAYIGPGRKALPVRSIEVQLGPTRWVPPSALGGSFRPVTASHVRTDRGIRPDTSITAVGAVHFTEHATDCRDLTGRQVATVFRNAQGGIVGGMLTETTVGVGPSGTSPLCARGDLDFATSGSIWPAMDTAADPRTEVYPYCDLA